MSSSRVTAPGSPPGLAAAIDAGVDPHHRVLPAVALRDAAQDLDVDAGRLGLQRGVRERVVPGIRAGQDALHQPGPADRGQKARLGRNLDRRAAVAEAAQVEPVGERIEDLGLLVAHLGHLRPRGADHVLDVELARDGTRLAARPRRSVGRRPCRPGHMGCEDAHAADRSRSRERPARHQGNAHHRRLPPAQPRRACGCPDARSTCRAPAPLVITPTESMFRGRRPGPLWTSGQGCPGRNLPPTTRPPPRRRPCYEERPECKPCFAGSHRNLPDRRVTRTPGTAGARSGQNCARKPRRMSRTASDATGIYSSMGPQ